MSYHLQCNLENLKNKNASLQARLVSLKDISDYIAGINCSDDSHMNFLIYVIDQLITALTDVPINEETVTVLISLLEEKLYIPAPHEPVYVLCGDNWLSQGITKILQERFTIVPLHMLNFQWAIDHEQVFFLLCDTKSNRAELSQVDPRRIYDVTLYLWYHFNIFPEFYTIHEEFLRKCGRIDGIITGMSYIRDAVKADFINGSFGTLANSSQDLYYDFKMFQYGEALCSNTIKHAIIGLAPYSLRYDESQSSEGPYRVRPYYYLLNDIHHCTALEKETVYFETTIRKIEQLLSAEDIRQLFNNFFVPKYGNGTWDLYQVFNAAQTQQSDAGALQTPQDEMAKKFNKPYEETLKENKVILHDYLDYLSRKQIQTIVLLPPFPRFYKEHWNPMYYYELLEHIHLLHEKFNFAFLDLTLLDLPDYCFRDFAHTNIIGAAIVAGKINECMASYQPRILP